MVRRAIRSECINLDGVSAPINKMKFLYMEGDPLESEHYFREKGANAEKIIHDLSIKTFFTDWCYPNPPRPGGKELCDLLVVFDDTAIIWQIKDLKVDTSGRYKQAEVDKNLRQLSGARRTLFDIKSSVKLSNPRRGEELFDLQRSRRYISSPS
jgi:hypothetical protein